jgi:hypothetical protein
MSNVLSLARDHQNELVPGFERHFAPHLNQSSLGLEYLRIIVNYSIASPILTECFPQTSQQVFQTPRVPQQPAILPVPIQNQSHQAYTLAHGVPPPPPTGIVTMGNHASASPAPVSNPPFTVSLKIEKVVVNALQEKNL